MAFVLILLLSVSAINVKADDVQSESLSTLAALAEYAGTDIESLLNDRSFVTPGDSVSDWLAFDYGRMGLASYADKYLKELTGYVSEKYKETGFLDGSKATSYHRTILTAASLGGDPLSFGKDKDGNPVNLAADGVYDFSAADSFDIQGLNAWIYALLAIDCKEYEIPGGAKYTRDDIISHILSAQSDDGGFGLMTGASDIDITAMALQALAPYKDSKDVFNTEKGEITASEAIDKAIIFLSDSQTEDGAFASGDTKNAESCAQVVMALCCLGIDPETDERFIKDGISVKDALMSFQNESGLFEHTIGDGDFFMATEQSLRALIAFERLKEGKTSLYDLSDVEINENTDNSINPMLIIIPIAALAAVFIIVLKKKGKNNGSDKC